MRRWDRLLCEAPEQRICHILIEFTSLTKHFTI